MSQPDHDATAKAVADRLTLEKVAANYNHLLALQADQRVTQAQLIRWCLQAIDKPQPQQNRGRISSFNDWKRANEKWKADKLLAREALRWLADKLEGKDVPDFMTS